MDLPDLNINIIPSEEISGENLTPTQAEEISNANVTTGSRIFLTNNERTTMYNYLLTKCIDGKLSKVIIDEVAGEWGVNERTIRRIWLRGKTTGNVCHQKTANVGRKRIAIDLSSMSQIPLNERSTIRSLADALSVPPTRLYNALKVGSIRRTSNPVKLFLTDDNKRARLQFCLSMIDESTIQHEPTFKDMYNVVHINEKWFYMTKKLQRYYLLPEEDNPMRTCKSKNFIAKVMFLAVTARPRFDSSLTETFSKKIGVFPFVMRVLTKRNSANRIAGTVETKPMTSVTHDVMRSFMLEKVLPAIKEKWPEGDSHEPIFIQQDNVRTHIGTNDPQFCEATTQDGFDIRLMCQPSNSPDLNILDLGFFAAIQSMQQKISTRTIDELVTAVEQSFENYPMTLSNRIFLTLQTCMVEIMKIKGCNNYKIPHIKKALLERENDLPITLKCDIALVQETVAYLGGGVDLGSGP